MDIYKYQILTGKIPVTEPPLEPCLSGTVNDTSTTVDCDCPDFIRIHDGNHGNGYVTSTNFTGLFDYDRISGVTMTQNTQQQTYQYEFTAPISALGGYQLGDIVVMYHDAISTFAPRMPCLNEQGPHCFIYIQQGYNPTGYNYWGTYPGPAPWKSPIFPFDNLGTMNVGTGGATTGAAGGVTDEFFGQWACCDDEEIISTITTTNPNPPIGESAPVDRTLTIFLDQDFNDIGFYTPFDGGIFHKDTFSNFVIQPLYDMGNDGYWVKLTNSTPFGLYEDTQGFSWTIDWGDGLIQQLQYPTIDIDHEYISSGPSTITVQMVAPWGITSMSQPMIIPYFSGGTLLNIPNPNLSFTYTPPGGGPPLTQNWMYSTFGPLDSGTHVQQYVSTNYASLPLTVTGLTESQLSGFQTYSTAPSNSPFLPNGYFLNQIVPIGGDIQIDANTFTPILYGEITNATSTFTAYTISDGGGGYGSPVNLFDYENGVTVFEVDTIGLNQYSLFTQSCDPIIEEVEDDPDTCDFCLGIDTGTGQNVVTNKGQWESGTGYIPGDLVIWAGCCWFVSVSAPPADIPPNDPAMFGTVWYPCEGQNCTATQVFTGAEIFGCTDPAALNYDSTATVDDGSCLFDVNVEPTNTGTLGGTTGYDDGLGGYGQTGTIDLTVCCDTNATNYDPGCSAGGLIHDPTECTYLGGQDGLWVCDPGNNLMLRCEDDGSGNIVGDGCSAVEHPTQFAYTQPSPWLNIPDKTANCGNAVPTPDVTMIDICQNGDGTSPGLDPNDVWEISGANADPNSNGGRGTGCVRIDKAWHPHNTYGSAAPSPGGNYQNGPTSYGGAWDWEMATIIAGNATGSGPLYAWINNEGALPPSNVPVNWQSNQIAMPNTANPVVELTQMWQAVGLPQTFTSYCQCMAEHAGCPSSITNYLY